MLSPDTLLQDRYLILRQLGAGGMGAVYVATDQRLGSTVALKETFFKDTVLRKAFEREARLLNSLRHASLPHVTDYFAEGEGQFLVMQFIPGKDLAELLEERNDTPFAVDDVLRWADHLLDALEYVHTHEPPIVHRDIKPQNLKLTPRGEIILLDFGLAKGSASAGVPLVSLSVRGYTPHYAPLEQIQGKGTDPRSDLYALAATLYHLLTGEIPPDAVTRATASVSGQPDPMRLACELNPQVPEPVALVLARAMAQNPGHRPDTAAMMRRELHEAKQGIKPSAATSPIGQPSGRATEVLSGSPASLATNVSSATTVNQPAAATAQVGTSIPEIRPATHHRLPVLIGIGAALLTLIVAAGIVVLRPHSPEAAKSTATQAASPGDTSGSSATNSVRALPAVEAAALPGMTSSMTEFHVVVIDEKGRITEQRNDKARAFTQPLNENVNLTMIEIPGGRFRMGSPDSEPWRVIQEGPQHEVTVSPFLLGQYEVTQAQWLAVARWPKVQRDLNPDPSKFKGAQVPVDDITWEDAAEFCARLSKKTGQTYRLPTEAEWEYACRAGSTTPFHIGKTITPDMVNYDGNRPYEGGPKGPSRQRSVPVGNYNVANAFGLFDMHGNVWEWTQDVWHDSYSGAPTDGSAWQKDGDPTYHVVRGGSWLNNADECRSASRSSARRDASFTRLGFRVAMTAPPARR